MLPKMYTVNLTPNPSKKKKKKKILSIIQTYFRIYQQFAAMETSFLII